MRRPTLPERLAPFALFGARELSTGRPLVARLMGRKLDRLFEEAHYERPFDARFGKAMLKTLSQLCAALGCSFGYAERGELSLYAISGGGDARRLLSRIAGEASARLSLQLGQVVTFDCQLYEFPDVDLARDYFRWRQEEGYLLAVDTYCVHVLSQSGADQSAVPRILDGLGPDEKVELLRQNSLDFATVPAWQRRGATVRVRPPEAGGPGDGADGLGKLTLDLNLPADDEYGDYLRGALVPNP